MNSTATTSSSSSEQRSMDLSPHQLGAYLTTPYGITLLCFLGAHLLVWAILYKLRNREPFASRHMKLTIMSNVGGLLMVFVICIREQDPASFSCGLYVILSNLFVYLYGGGYVVRAVWLRFLHNCCKETCHYVEVDDFNHKRQARKQHTITIVILLLALTVHVTIAVFELLRLAHNSGSHYMTHGCWMHFELEVFLIQFGVYLVFMVVMVIVIIRLSEAYWIGTELRLCMICWMVFGSLFFIFTLLPGMDKFSKLFPQSSWLLIAIGVTFLISDVCPILTYLRWRRMQKRLISSVSYERLTDRFSFVGDDIELEEGVQQPSDLRHLTALDHIIDSSSLQEKFRQMVMFWLQAVSFQFLCEVRSLQKKDISSENLLPFCKTIYRKYLDEESHSGDSVKAVHPQVLVYAKSIGERLEQGNARYHMFDDIYNLVKEDLEKRMLIYFQPDSESGRPFIVPFKLLC